MRYRVKVAFFKLERWVSRGLFSLKRLSGQGKPAAVFLAYHTLADLEAVPPTLWGEVVQPRSFRSHLRFLLSEGYQFFTVSEWVAGECTGKSVVVTFDDGYESVYREAYPILHELRVKATVFVTTQFVDGAIAPPWNTENRGLMDDYEKTRRIWRPLTWPQVRDLSESGIIEIGSHGCHHLPMGRLEDAAMREEFRLSRRQLEQQIRARVTSFSYPFGIAAYGAHSMRSRALLSEEGYSAACTGEIGRIQPGIDPLALPRMLVRYADDPRDLQCKLEGACDWTSTMQRIYHRLFASPFSHDH